MQIRSDLIILENTLRMLDLNDNLCGFPYVITLYMICDRKCYTKVSISNCSNIRICLTALYKHD